MGTFIDWRAGDTRRGTKNDKKSRYTIEKGRSLLSPVVFWMLNMKVHLVLQLSSLKTTGFIVTMASNKYEISAWEEDETLS
jgi:hypothetical protein